MRIQAVNIYKVFRILADRVNDTFVNEHYSVNYHKI